MALIDPLTLGIVRPSAYTETKTFTNVWRNPDGKEIEVALTLTCRALDNADGYVVIDQANALARAYAPNNGSIPKVVMLGDRPIAMSSEMCNSVANVLISQDGADRYDFEALARYAVLLQEKWYEVMIWLGEINQRGKDAGKASSTDSPTP